jgi:membrane protein DedA with SNARE-associated domain
MSDLIVECIRSWGYAGIALLMALENVFPPVPSELIMPFAGYVAASGDLHIAGVIGAGAAGSVAGSLPWYFLGRHIGRERLARWVKAHGRWFTVTPEELERAEGWFNRHGGWSLLAGRLVPAVRSVITLPAGVEAMPLAQVVAWSACGAALWSGALAAVGYALEDRYESISPWIDRASTAVVVGLVAWYLWRIVRFRPSAA